MPTPADFRHLIAKAKGGEERALAAVLQYLVAPLEQWVTRRAPLPSRVIAAFADEVVEETLVRVALRIRDCRAATEEGVLTWALAIARRVALDLGRTSAVRLFLATVALEATADIGLTDAPAHAPDPLDERLLQVLFAQPAWHSRRNAVLLWYRLVQRATWAQIGQALHIPPGVAKQRWRRLLREIHATAQAQVAELDATRRPLVLAALARRRPR